MFFKKNTSTNYDVEQVCYAAALLNVTEFRLFELAYDDWFGEAGSEGMLEVAYMSYVICGKTPIWVRNYARKTRQLGDEAGMYLPQIVTLPEAHPVLNRDNAIVLLGLFLILLLLF